MFDLATNVVESTHELVVPWADEQLSSALEPLRRDPGLSRDEPLNGAHELMKSEVGVRRLYPRVEGLGDPSKPWENRQFLDSPLELRAASRSSARQVGKGLPCMTRLGLSMVDYRCSITHWRSWRQELTHPLRQRGRVRRDPPALGARLHRPGGRSPRSARLPRPLFGSAPTREWLVENPIR